MSTPPLRPPHAAQGASETPAQHPIPPGTRDYPGSREYLPTDEITAGRYLLRFASTAAELDRVLRLRFEVFNLELGEGLDEAYRTGRDEDDLDVHFHHLMILCRDTGEVVGTYRMQTAEMAARLGGFYSAGEFDLSRIAPEVMERSVEIGRACVAKDHRNGRVLHLLWRGLATYLAWNRKAYLFGCCSLTSQDAAVGEAAFRHLLAQDTLHPAIAVTPLPGLECEVAPDAALPPAHIPALFQSYLNLGAKICGPPAIDRLFKTIDFLVVLNADELAPRTFRSFFR